jgi:glycosyltransferase involved in cell wall biosynthesis
MACGTSVVAFDATGPRDIIKHKKTGFLAEPFAVDELTKGIVWSLECELDLGESARTDAKNKYQINKIGKKYWDLYTSII